MKAADVVIEIVSRKRCALLSRRWSENAQRHVGHHVNLFLDTDMAEIPGWLDLRLIEVNPCRISINSPHGTGLQSLSWQQSCGYHECPSAVVTPMSIIAAAIVRVLIDV